MNQIIFPAAILQPPFFDPNADPAVNYGGIGAVIGHEMGHGFDDQGAQVRRRRQDSQLVDAGDARPFKSSHDAARRAVRRLLPAPRPVHVNGALTMGENIGDLGGLEMAYTAYQLSLGGKEAPVIDGFTGDQRFFMAHAQVWRGMYREDAQVSQLRTDPHSPGAARGSIPERNVDAWYTAFAVTESDAAYLKPEDRVHIW